MICVYSFLYTYVHVYVYTYLYTDIHTCRHVTCAHRYVYVYIYICVYVYVNVDVDIDMFTWGLGSLQRSALLLIIAEVQTTEACGVVLKSFGRGLKVLDISEKEVACF